MYMINKCNTLWQQSTGPIIQGHLHQSAWKSCVMPKRKKKHSKYLRCPMGNTISIKPLISFNKSLHLPSYQWDEIPVSTPGAAQWLWCQSNKSTVFSNALLKTRSHKWELGSLQGKIASQTPIHRSFLSEHTHIITSPSYRGSKTAPVNFIWCNDFSPRWKYKPYIYIYI